MNPIPILEQYLRAVYEAAFHNAPLPPVPPELEGKQYFCGPSHGMKDIEWVRGAAQSWGRADSDSPSPITVMPTWTIAGVPVHTIRPNTQPKAATA